MQKELEKLRKSNAEKDALLRKRTAAQEARAAESLKVPPRGGGAAKKPAAKRVQQRARKKKDDSDSDDESSRDGPSNSDDDSDENMDSEVDAGKSDNSKRRARPSGKADDSRKQARPSVGKQVAPVAAAAVKGKAKNPTAKKGSAVVNSDDSERDDGLTSGSDESETTVVIKDFRWKTANRYFGYFTVVWDDEVKEQKCDVKDLLYDFGEEGLRFIWEKYGNWLKVRDYVGKCAMSKHGGGKTGLQRRTCVPEFKGWKEYAFLKKWPEPGWVNATGIKKLRYQTPPVDDPMKLKRKIKSIVGNVDRSKMKKAPPETSGGEEGSVGGAEEGAQEGIETSLVNEDSGIGEGGDSSAPVNSNQVLPESEGRDSTAPVGIVRVMPESGGGGDSETSLVETDSGKGRDSNAPVGSPPGPYAEVKEVVGGGGVLDELGREEGGGVVDGNQESFIHTPTFKRVANSFMTEESSPESACELPKKHKWNEFAKGSYVSAGDLGGGKSCVGIRDGKVCGRVFVAKAIENGVHITEDQYHPTTKNIAYGCKICYRAMCAPCYRSYQVLASPSTVRNTR